MKMTRIAALGLAAFVGSAGLVGTAWAQELVLKSADVHPPGYPTVVAVEDMGRKLSEATDGRLSATLL